MATHSSILARRIPWTEKPGGLQSTGCKESVVLEKTLESPLDIKEIKPANFKGNQPEYSLEGLLLKLKL